MNLIPWDRPRGAVHDAQYLESLSDSRDILCCLSERSFYLLLNLANQDAGFLGRYSVERLENGYLPCTRDHALYPVVADAYNALQLELTDMSCDIVAALNEIRDAVVNLSVGISVGSQAVCCYEITSDNWSDDPPVPGEPVNLCQLAYAYALYWEAGANEMYHQWALGAFPALGVIAAIFDEFDIPAQSLLEMVTWGYTHAVPLLESLWRIATANLVWDITCAIYGAGGPAEAQQAILLAIDDIEGLEGVAAELMKAPITYSGLNKVYDGSFPVEGIETPDCGDCEEGPAGDLFLTRESEPYNQLIIGDSITFDASNTDQGYRGQNNGKAVELFFTPTGVATTWEWQAEISAPYYPGTQKSYVAHLQVWDGDSWNEVKQFGPTLFDADEWTLIYHLVEDAPLSALTPYKMFFSIQDFNLYIFYRAIAGGTIT